MLRRSVANMHHLRQLIVQKDFAAGTLSCRSWLAEGLLTDLVPTVSAALGLTFVAINGRKASTGQNLTKIAWRYVYTYTEVHFPWLYCNIAKGST